MLAAGPLSKQFGERSDWNPLRPIYRQDAFLGLAASTLSFASLDSNIFPTRSQAAREMYRVLKPDGRLVVLAWRALEHSPGFAAIAAAAGDAKRTIRASALT